MSETNRPNPEFYEPNKANQKTIEAYNNNLQEYINGTPHEVSGEMKVWLDKSVENLPKTARILEFGSGFGRDAAYLENSGYSVQRTDAASAFVDLLREQNFEAEHLDAIHDKLPDNQDLVLANAVLLHFKREKAISVIQKTYDALNQEGTFAFTLKQGEGESWSEDKLSSPRYFCYWKSEQIRPVLEEIGFSEVDINGDSEGHGASEDSPWLSVIAKK